MTNSCPPGIRHQVEAAARLGSAIELVESPTQCYVHACGLSAPSPPWDRNAYDILVAIPADDAAALDAFYMPADYQFGSGRHPRAGNSGTLVSLLGRDWLLVSWHYPAERPWQWGRDDLSSHITHCQGFFSNRGALNGY